MFSPYWKSYPQLFENLISTHQMFLLKLFEMALLCGPISDEKDEEDGFVYANGKRERQSLLEMEMVVEEWRKKNILEKKYNILKLKLKKKY